MLIMSNLKEEGNKFFVEKEYEKALECYKEALDICEKSMLKLKELDKLNEDGGNDTEDEDEEIVEKSNDELNNSYNEEITKISNDKSILNSNIAATLCNLEKYGEALEFGIECTKLRPKWFKSWYRLAVVLNKLKKYEQALTTIDKAIECSKEDGQDVPLTLSDLKDEIESKLRKSKKQESNDGIEVGDNKIPLGLGEGMNPFIGELMKNEDLKEKMQDPLFKEKMMKNKNNPMALLGDPEVMNLVGKLANNLNMNK
jgi:tetratricopeptide (TPR) repeat protein